MRRDSTYVILGGAGYLGRHLVELLRHRDANKTVVVVTRNKDKGIFFEGHKGVSIEESLEAIQTDCPVVLINAAFSEAPSHRQVIKDTHSLFDQIELFFEKNTISAFVHISSIVLSLDHKAVGLHPVPYNRFPYSEESPYAAGKGLAEIRATRIAKRKNIPTAIIRSGNILGPGSPWVNKLTSRMLSGSPIGSLSSAGFSNATFVWNVSSLVLSIAEHLKTKEQKLMVMNCAEFGDYTWGYWARALGEVMAISEAFWRYGPPNQTVFSDMRTTLSKMIGSLILGAVKLPSSGKLFEKLIGFLNRDSLASRARRVAYAKSDEWSLAEIRNYQVFAQANHKGLEGVPDSLADPAVRDPKIIVRSLQKWARESRLDGPAQETSTISSHHAK